MKSRRSSREPVFILFLSLIYFIGISFSLNGEAITFYAKKVTSSIAQGKEYTALEGDVKVTVGEQEINALKLEILGSDRNILVGNGDIKVINNKDKMFITGEHFTYNRKTEIVELNGNIYVEDQGNNVVLRCEYLRYEMKTKRLRLQVNVRIVDKEIVAHSEFADYSRNDKILELFGAPIVYKDTDRYEASQIHVDLKTRNVSLVDGASGHVETD